MPDEKQMVLRAIWRDKMHVEPRALELSPRAVRDSFEHIWEPADILMENLRGFPLGALRVWQNSARGHVVFTHRPSSYQTGPQPWRDTSIKSVVHLSLRDLRQSKRNAMLAFLHFLDHLLGSEAAKEEPWLSDGGGITPALREVGSRFLQIHDRGYGHNELGVSTTHDYFAHTLWLYLQDPRRLNVMDPQVYKLYRNTLMREDFWPST